MHGVEKYTPYCVFALNEGYFHPKFIERSLFNTQEKLMQPFLVKVA